jgi:hypothetical protein
LRRSESGLIGSNWPRISFESERDAAEKRARNAEQVKASALLVAEEAMRLAAERKARGRARLRAAWRDE